MQPETHYTEINRHMWNETAKVHADAYVNELFERIGSPDFTTFDAVEQKIFDGIGLAGKTVAQLSCNNGRELIAVKKADAGRCVGFDISDNFMEQARQLAEAGGVEVEFVRTNLYDIPTNLPEFVGQFDVVYITIGVFGWLADVDAVFAVIARLLKPGGQLFIYEMHPILDIFDPDKGTAVVESYFRTEPFYEEEDPDYFNPDHIVEAPSYWFPHKLSDIISGCINHGLNLTHFEEHPKDLSMVYASFEPLDHKPPLSYSLVAQKEG